MFESVFFGERLFMDRRDAPSSLRHIPQTVVVGLDTPLKRIDQCHRARAKVERLKRSAARWLDQRRELRGRNLDFFHSVSVEIEPIHRLIPFWTNPYRVGECFCLYEFAPQRGPQMRCIEPAEDPLPVGVIALRAEQMCRRFGAIRSSPGTFPHT